MTDEAPATVAEKPARSFPGVWMGIAWVIAFFGIQIICSIVAIGIAAALHTPPLTDPAQLTAMAGDIKFVASPTIWGLVASSVLTLMLLWLYLRRHNHAADIHLNRWSQISLKQTLIWSVGLVLLGFIFNLAYEAYVIPGVEMQKALQLLFAEFPKTPVNAVILFLTIAIMAPVIEEIVFRGLLQKSLSLHLPAAVAIAISALAFAALHLDYYAFPAVFIMGAIFGFIYLKTGSLRVNIVLHVLNNAAAYLLS
jgi:uncharacterized protein